MAGCGSCLGRPTVENYHSVVFLVFFRSLCFRCNGQAFLLSKGRLSSLRHGSSIGVVAASKVEGKGDRRNRYCFYPVSFYPFGRVE